jgi:hypothetical protein
MEYDWDNGPEKLLTEGYAAAVRNGLHYLMLKSGGRSYVFVFPVQLGEAIGRTLSEQVAEVEKQTGQKIVPLERSNDPKAVGYDWKQIGSNPDEPPKK